MTRRPQGARPPPTRDACGPTLQHVIPESFDLSMLATAADVERLAVIGVELEAVDAALRRLDEDRYGLCEVCGGPVEESRLELEPLAPRCADHLLSSGNGGLDPEPGVAWEIEPDVEPDVEAHLEITPDDVF
jgi:Prokaryotic dksA/traR C4-type zinc finger